MKREIARFPLRDSPSLAANLLQQSTYYLFLLETCAAIAPRIIDMRARASTIYIYYRDHQNRDLGQCRADIGIDLLRFCASRARERASERALAGRLAPLMSFARARLREYRGFLSGN